MIKVTTEINRLQKVMLQRPGLELEQLTPEYLERLLFDDIPYLQGAQREHDAFADALRGCDVEVVYLSQLTAQALDLSSDIRNAFISDFIKEAGPVALNYRRELTKLLSSIERNEDLIEKVMAGVTDRELTFGRENPLCELVHRKTRFILDPIPNLYFTRDPFACIGRGVSLNRMYSATRMRETIFGRYIFKYHPEYNKTPLYYDPSQPFSIEGGDILNLSPNLLAIGISQRTTPEAIELLAKKVFSDPESQVKTILAFDIPNMRAFMHLDTVFTQVDKGKFTIHPGIIEPLRVYKLTSKGKKLSAQKLSGTLTDILKRELELDEVSLIACGGTSSIAAEREQWNDGSNTLCIAPGVVVVYDRNRITNEILRDNGLRTIEVPSSELSRGRGGPRCMSMPLIRAD